MFIKNSFIFIYSLRVENELKNFPKKKSIKKS